jgi:hypothetical protein
VPVRVEQQILRIAQEAISNCIRHARATQIQADLGFGMDEVSLKARLRFLTLRIKLPSQASEIPRTFLCYNFLLNPGKGE